MPHWRRTLYTIWITEFVAILGFSFVTPFIPYYIQELGVTDRKEVALWAGTATSVMSFGAAIMAPVWGMLADRHGRKMSDSIRLCPVWRMRLARWWAPASPPEWDCSRRSYWLLE